MCVCASSSRSVIFVPAPRQDGTNALMAAASNGHLESATLLVKAGAALDKQNSDGHSALMFAYNGRAQVCVPAV